MARKQPSFDLETFYITNRSRAISRAKLLGGRNIDAEGAASAAWIGFIGKALKGEIGNPDAYLFTCIRNAVIDAQRQAGRSVPWDTDNLEWLASRTEDQVTQDAGPYWPGGLEHPRNPGLAAAFEKLSAQQRAVMVLWAETNPPRTDKEIGMILNISPKTVGTHRSRAIEKLRKEMGRGGSYSSEEASRSPRLHRW